MLKTSCAEVCAPTPPLSRVILAALLARKKYPNHQHSFASIPQLCRHWSYNTQSDCSWLSSKAATSSTMVKTMAKKSTPLPLEAMEIRLTHDQARELVGTARARRSSPLFLHLHESWISQGFLEQFESLDDFQQLDGVMSGTPFFSSEI